MKILGDYEGESESECVDKGEGEGECVGEGKGEGEVEQGRDYVSYYLHTSGGSVFYWIQDLLEALSVIIIGQTYSSIWCFE